MKQIKIVIERHEDGYVGYPLGFTPYNGVYPWSNCWTG